MAEILILLAVVLGIAWLLAPVRRRVRAAVSRVLRLNRPGRVIEGAFRPVKPDPKEKKDE